MSGRALSQAKAGTFAAELEQREEADAELADEGLDDQQAIALLGILNQIFQIQIDFLKHLQRAADGLTSEASRAWFDATARELGHRRARPGALARMGSLAVARYFFEKTTRFVLAPSALSRSKSSTRFGTRPRFFSQRAGPGDEPNAWALVARRQPGV